MPTGELQIHRATPDRWDDVGTVMGTRGDPARCWCQFFRFRGMDWQSADRAANRARLRHQVAGGPTAPGVLAYRDGAPVGWCAVGPRGGYPRLVASRLTEGESDGVWAVTCFVVRVGNRRQGIARALLPAAVDLARDAGATVVEGYPVDVEARRSVAASELYRGTLSMFLDAGFHEVRRPFAAQVVVRFPTDAVTRPRRT